MRVLHVTEAPLGGVLSHIEELTRIQMADRSIDAIAILCPTVNTEILSSTVNESVRLYSYPRLGRSLDSLVRLATQFIRVLKDFAPDVIHVHSTIAGVIIRPICAVSRRNIAIIYTPHSWSFSRLSSSFQSSVWSAIERTMARMTDVIICVSHQEKAAADRAGIGLDICRVVHNGIDPGRYPSKVVEPPDRAAPKRILFVGRLDQQKGFDIFLDVMSKLGNAAEAVVVGDSIVGPKFSGRVPDNVKLAGWKDRPDVYAALCECDLVLMPSRWEGLPMLALEAMRAGTPVFATTVGGLPEMILDRQTGMLFAAEDVDGIADAIRSISKEELVQMGNAAKTLFATQYTSQKMARLTMDAYLTALDARRDRWAKARREGANWKRAFSSNAGAQKQIPIATSLHEAYRPVDKR